MASKPASTVKLTIAGYLYPVLDCLLEVNFNFQGTRPLLIRVPNICRTAGRRVMDAKMAIAVTIIPPRPIVVKTVTRGISKAARAAITVNPLKNTDRPAVSILRLIAFSTKGSALSSSRKRLMIKSE